MFQAPDDLEKMLLPLLSKLTANEDLMYKGRPIRRDFSGFWVSGGFVGQEAIDIIRFIQKHPDWFID